MKRLYQLAIVIAFTAVGAALGWCVLHWTGFTLAQHFAHGSQSAKPAVNNFGDMIANLFFLSYYAGLLTGVVMTLAVFGGLVAGFAFARRVETPNGLPQLKAA